MRDFHQPGRSVVYARNGVAATSHPGSSLVAIDILRRGGNAVDAAVAAVAHQGIVEPMATGIGGDCFALIWKAKERRLVAINGSGFAPAALSSERLLAAGIDKLTLQSPHSVTVPGAVDAWCRLIADHGNLPLAEVLRPAIGAAREGFPISENVAHEWRDTTGKLEADANARRHFLPEGRAPRPGEIFRATPMAEALETIAREGRDGFYGGWVAEDMVASLRALGATHAIEDFAAYRAQYVEPISSTYRSLDVCGLPPNDLGLTTNLMLNILEHFDLAALGAGSPGRYHLLLEASRLAFAVRAPVVGDPAFGDVPTSRLLSKELAAELAARIKLDGPLAELPEAPRLSGSDTVALSVVDAERNVVSIVNSLFHKFGSGLASASAGIMFQNRGAAFVVNPQHPNGVAPRKRPAHTIMPTIVMKDGAPYLSVGVKGGLYQPVGLSQVITNIVDFGMDVQRAIDFPRVSYGESGKVDVERTVPEPVRARLAALGHPVAESREPLGGAQAILIDNASGVLAAGSDCRKDGAAIGW
jgi:gamma-glutamyltranspeptidase/glutathione hydrolase